MEKITSVNNDKIKQARLIASDAAFSKKSGLYMLEGARLCGDAAQAGARIVRAFFESGALKKYEKYISAVTAVCGDCCEISAAAAEKLAGTKNTQGVFCLCRRGETESGIKSYTGKYLALENVQDPANLGAICRTAEALGLDGLIVCGGCDLYNPKVLRSAMGCTLRLEITETGNLAELIEQANANGMLTLASVPDRTAKDIRQVSAKGGVICCIGNEGNGLSDAVIEACGERVTIPMQGSAESFNAAAAAAILAWELKR